tara:strand:+ start:411 stop:527 length:117 start_codon:yes stop_codon:yes gene_type:complete
MFRVMQNLIGGYHKICLTLFGYHATRIGIAIKSWKVAA